MSRKIARITQEKKLLLANEVVEDNTKIRLDSDGRLDIDEIIEYPTELEGGRNLLPNSEEEKANDGSQWRPEFLRTYDLAPIFEKYGLDREYSLSFELKSADTTKNNRIQVYMQSGSGTKYNFINKIVEVTEEYQRFVFEGLKPTEGTEGYNTAHLSFYGTYDTGNIPIVRKIKLELGSQATPWTPAPEDLGLNYPDSIQNFNSSISGNNIIVPEFIEGYPFVKPVIDDSLVLWLDGSTGNNYEQTGIWKDLSGNGNHGQLMNFAYTEDSGWVDGGLKFDGVDDYVQTANLGILNNMTLELSIYSPEIQGNVIWTAGDDTVIIYANGRSYIKSNTGSKATFPNFVLGGVKTTLAIVYNTEKQKAYYYQDGKEIHSDLLPSNSTEFDFKSLNIFADYSGGLNKKGEIYYVRIYNRALTDEEILQNYRAGQCSPLLAMRGDV